MPSGMLFTVLKPSLIGSMLGYLDYSSVVNEAWKFEQMVDIKSGIGGSTTAASRRAFAVTTTHRLRGASNEKKPT
jgi:hypothetical protein